MTKILRRSIVPILLGLAPIGCGVRGEKPASADTAPNQVDLRVLVISDGTNWAEGFKQRLDEEGIPHTDVNLWDAGRPIITAGFLSAGTEASYQAVFTPDGTAGNLPVAELAALRAYEAQFGVRADREYVNDVATQPVSIARLHRLVPEIAWIGREDYYRRVLSKYIWEYASDTTAAAG